MDQVTNCGNSAENAQIALTYTESVVSRCIKLIAKIALCTIGSAVKFVLWLQNPLMRAVIAQLRNFLLTEMIVL